MVRDLERKMASRDTAPEAVTREQTLANRLLSQERTGANKLCSLHAPEMERISKGKADKGYRGHETWPGIRIVLPGQRSRTSAERRWRRTRLPWRCVIDALIGHMEVDGLMGHNWLKGVMYDAIHAILCAVVQNLRLLLERSRILCAVIRGVFWNGSSRCNRSRRTYRMTIRPTPAGHAGDDRA